jgi:hypothetical protein
VQAPDASVAVVPERARVVVRPSGVRGAARNVAAPSGRVVEPNAGAAVVAPTPTQITGHERVIAE